MAYINKYKITMATKSGSISTLYLLEDGYSGALIEYPAVKLELSYIPRSDDIFEAIYVSQLSVVIDVTDDINNMPNLTTLNDRKYLCKLFYDETLEWQGWALSDSVSFSFSTGRKELSFNGVDGLGMLEKIPFPVPVDYILSDFNTCFFYILGSLNSIAFPDNLNILTGISYYAEGMADRAEISWADPLTQSFLNYGTFINDSRAVDNCLLILSKIIQGFGARLFQAEGKWNIVSISQFAQSSYWFTEYNNTGLVVDSGTKSFIGEIQGFVGNTSGLFFIDNNQTKLLRKGYSKIDFTKQIEYPSNYITNWDLKQYVVGSPAYAWTENPNGGIMFVVPYPNLAFNSYLLDVTNAIAPNYDMSLQPTYFPKIAFNESVQLSFDSSIASVGTGWIPDCFFILKIKLLSATTFYYYTNDNGWVTGPDLYYQNYDANTITSTINITTDPVPETGTISFEYILAKPASIYLKSTVVSAEVRNFSFTIIPSFVSYQCIGSLNDTDEYVFKPSLEIGFNDNYNGYYSYKGFLADSTGLNLKNWYRYEYYGDFYRSLSELVIRQYSNNLNKNVINIDSSFMGMNTSDGRFSGAMRITATDTDPAQISVSSKKYMVGNTTIDLFNDIIQGTLLDINDQNIEANVYEIINSNSKPPYALGNSHLRSNSYETSAEAADGTLTTDLIYTLSTITTPDIGDVFYFDQDCAIPFDGGYLWYKVVTVFPNTNVYQIRIDGVILNIFS
jgi:hypothetical protein